MVCARPWVPSPAKGGGRKKGGVEGKGKEKHKRKTKKYPFIP